MLLRLIIVAIVLCGFTSAPTRADTPEKLPVADISRLQDEIVSWLGEMFELPNSALRPRIVLTPQAQITALRFRGLIPTGATNGAHDIVAVYDESEQTIHLPEKWTGKSAAEQSVLVHEMVHFLQSVEKTIFECPQAREKLAYKAQNRWLHRFDLSLESEFGLDPFSLLIHTNCSV